MRFELEYHLQEAGVQSIFPHPYKYASGLYLPSGALRAYPYGTRYTDLFPYNNISVHLDSYVLDLAPIQVPSRMDRLEDQRVPRGQYRAALHQSVTDCSKNALQSDTIGLIFASAKE